MSDMALRKPASAVRNKTSVSRKHRGEASDTMRVLGQTAAVAGISGALLLSLKAMVLVAPAVLPNGSGLDALGRLAPNVAAAVEDLAAPVAISRVVNDPFSTQAAPRVSGVSERNGASVDRGPSSGSGSTTVPRQGNGNGNSGSNSGSNTGNTGNTGGNTGGGTGGNTGNTGGGTKAPVVKDKGAVGGVVGTLGGVLDGVAPGTGKTVEDTIAPVTDTVDGAASSLGLDKAVGGVTGKKSAKDSGSGGVLGGVTDTLGVTDNGAGKPGLVDGVGKTLGGLGLGLG